MRPRGRVVGALGFGVVTETRDVWSHGFHWGDVLFDLGLIFVMWIGGGTLWDRWQRRRARRAAARKASFADIAAGFGDQSVDSRGRDRRPGPVRGPRVGASPRGGRPR